MFALNFDDADVYTIIQTIFGEALRVNYVVDPRVKGRVTFRATAPVPTESVLPLMEVILRLNGIGIVEENGLYRIVPIGDISKEPSPVHFGRDPAKIPTTGKALLQVVPIEYVQSSEVLRLITPFASNNAVLIDVPKGNQVIIVDTDANVKRMLKLVEIFDNERLRQRKPKVFVYPVQNGKAKDIAGLLQQIYMGARAAGPDQAAPLTATKPASGTPGLTPPSPPLPSLAQQAHLSSPSAGGDSVLADFTRIIPDEVTNTITILSTPEDYTSIQETIRQIDIVPRQVIIEGMIASVSLTDNLSLGIAGLYKQSVFGLDALISLNPKALSVNPSALSNTGFTAVGLDSAGAVRALITALATQSKAKVLASPHVLVSDNRDAKIQVGQQVPLVTSETYGTPGVAPQRNYQYRDIGIILKVRPRINEGGLVALEIYQEISTYDKFPIGTEEQILLNKTDASTNLVVQDGQTIVIGGLIREDATKSRTGLPFLTKIPFLGWLFGTTDDDMSRQEIIILLTPHVIKNQKEARDVSTDFVEKLSGQSKGGIRKEELLPERPPRAPAEKPAPSPADGAGKGAVPAP
jgi:general secretion pathway protein D